MDQNNPNRLYATMGLAGQAGCLTVVMAVGALLIGLWLDQTFGTRPRFALICVVVSVPINLVVTLWVTQRLIARVIPPDKPKLGARSSSNKSYKIVDPEDEDQDQ
jgi:Putative F0F1-ATPase subunit Ca2+/Mg2+ transporter